MADQEKLQGNKEIVANPEALEQAGLEQHERIREQLEQAGEKSQEKLEDVRHEALEQAKSAEKEPASDKVERQASPAERRKDGPISKAERQKSYKRTMNQVQSEMSAPSRAFSKLIHNPLIEKTSEVVGSTVARPNAILSGSVFALIFTLGIFLIADYNGYPLKGSETIASFVIGWMVGLLFDYLRLEWNGGRK